MGSIPVGTTSGTGVATSGTCAFFIEWPHGSFYHRKSNNKFVLNNKK
jgi:hypothetical protein